MKKLLLVIVSAILLSACSLTKTSSTPNYQISDIKINPTNMDNSTPTQTPLAENITAVIKTNKGTMKVALFPKIAPNTVRNFVELAKGTRINPLTGKKVSDKPFYDGVIFHRVIEGFMIQGGDPLGSGMGGPGYKFADEPVTEEYSRGTIAMANAGPNTNGSQFFINTADNNFLDTKHTVFGRVVAGMDAVKAIETTPTGANDRPIEPMVIKSITLE